jgi:hypothetical protein
VCAGLWEEGVLDCGRGMGKRRRGVGGGKKIEKVREK